MDKIQSSLQKNIELMVNEDSIREVIENVAGVSMGLDITPDEFHDIVQISLAVTKGMSLSIGQAIITTLAENDLLNL